MKAPRAYARGVLLSRGVDLKFDSLREMAAISSILQERKVEFLRTACQVHASMQVQGHHVSRLLQQYRRVLFPDSIRADALRARGQMNVLSRYQGKVFALVERDGRLTMEVQDDPGLRRKS